MRALFVILAALLAGPTLAQASFVPYGQGCNNRGIPPTLPPTIYLLGSPAIGKTVDLGVSGGPVFAVRHHSMKILFTGISRTYYLGWALPLRIPPWVMNLTGDCDLLCSMECVETVRPVTIPIEIPSEPRLIGAQLHYQWYLTYFVQTPIFDAFSIVSNGGEMTIGL